MARWTDIAEWQGPAANNFGDGDYIELEPSDAMSRHDVVVIHIAEGTYLGTISWEDNPDSDISSHFVVDFDGSTTQMVDTHDRSWCQMAGNSIGISIEFAGRTPNLLTDAQLWSAARILAKAHQEYGIPLLVAATASERGLGHHSMDPAWGHQDCPGPAIIAQKPAIVARAQQIVNGTGELDMATIDDLYTTLKAIDNRVREALLNGVSPMSDVPGEGDGKTVWHVEQIRALREQLAATDRRVLAALLRGEATIDDPGEGVGHPVWLVNQVQALQAAVAGLSAPVLSDAQVAMMADRIATQIGAQISAIAAALGAAGTHLANAGASLAGADDTPLLPGGSGA